MSAGSYNVSRICRRATDESLPPVNEAAVREAARFDTRAAAAAFADARRGTSLVDYRTPGKVRVLVGVGRAE